MTLEFTVLGSGSSGNASLMRTNGFGLLLDIGLGPRDLTGRLAAVGASWRDVHAVLLTHTHTDHWNERTLAYLRRMQIRLYCHPDHDTELSRSGREFALLMQENLVRHYEIGEVIELNPGLHCRPLPVRHDSGATFGFRLETKTGLFRTPVALAYAADLGSWTTELADAMANVDALAIEFNHDVDMQYASGRSPLLIRRVLGDYGHLSNQQAADLLSEVLRRTEPGRLRHVIQLHLSRDCNRHDLAQEAAMAVLSDADDVTVHTARPDQPCKTLLLGGERAASKPGRNGAVRARRAKIADHPSLPGMDA